ncbi:aspartyl/asparaginyl beta-hydroxylase domain-containing protein [Thalassotalea sp. ND16A]|uniref:aspartyl/asparaginyl beta-hydroxylase domain-containing protein n=1 Tax=Thalassotalea sp. ND16A TaxID=1535422 RepID=UPI00051A0BEC|nr:aspartyl/asparaginyl beta-hydroxylase domain-containing protein [Thalassotalea sp. ND16A]KGJ90288.1 hypothetical protein ND16A_2018 [Thalassotalea sp. ND16A]
MKLKHEFFKLPLSFDIERLQAEVLQLTEQDWHAHHEGFAGNIAVPLLSVGGQINNDFKGPIEQTQALSKLPYIQQILASFNEVFGRSRLMALEPGCEVPIHTDINYHWYKRVRIHIPIITTENVIFHCADKQVNMAAGECWIFDSWKPHKVVNDSDIRRIHLVIDTMGSSKFWQMIDNSQVPGIQDATLATKHLEFDPQHKPNILMERFNAPVVMSPGELENLIDDLKVEINNPENNADGIIGFHQIIDNFAQDWRRLWSLYGITEQGWPQYHQLRDRTFQLARNFDNKLQLTNGGSALQMLIHCIIDPALSPEVAKLTNAAATPVKAKPTAVKPVTAKPAQGSENNLGQSGTANTNAAVVPASRNSPCSCGSGKKYKQCCGAL